MWKNSGTRYGRISRTMHWAMALLLIGLIALGLWMTGLTYYHRWYQTAPAIHEGLGVMAFLLFLLRLAWLWIDPPSRWSLGLKPWERRAAQATHRSFYLLMGIIPITGYLITTAKGLPVAVFGWFLVPALFPQWHGMADLAGKIHLYLGLSLAGLVLLHLGATLKHHFLDHDDTLAKMAGAWSSATVDVPSEQEKKP